MNHLKEIFKKNGVPYQEHGKLIHDIEAYYHPKTEVIQLYTAIHEHRFGTSVYLFRTELSMDDPTLELKIVNAFQIDFESERELITIVAADEKIPVIV